jgi:hypothetical protein
MAITDGRLTSRSPSMTRPKCRFILAAVALAVAFVAAPADAQRNPTVSRALPRGGGETEAPTRLSIRVGDQEYEFSGNARCVHAPRAALFDKPAKNWTVQVAPGTRGGLRSLALTIWRFDGAPARQGFSLNVEVGSTSHRISTLDGDPGQGRGEATLTARGAGGQIEVTGRTERGTSIRATIDCARFAAPYAVGG